jgi:tetratricopeptide (TPR) repeat protein
MMLRRIALHAGLVASLALASLPAYAAAPADVLQDAAAREHFDAAQAAFDRDDYAAAIPELKAAYAIEPNPMLLYAWAQAERFAGNCARASELYRQFLETEPAPEVARLARVNIRDCQAELGITPPKANPTTPAETETETETATETEPVPESDGDPAKPWYADGAGWALVGLGVVGMSVGLGVYVTGRRDTVDAPRVETESDYLEQVDRARVMQQAGVGVLGAGSGLLLAGIIRLVVVGVRSRKARENARAKVGFGPGVIRF